MRACLGMHRDVVASRLGKGFEIRIARRNHQMRVEDLLAVRTHRLDDVGPVGNVGHEMPVHHVEMDPVGAGGVDGAHLLAEFGEVRRQDRWRNHERDGGRRKRTSALSFESCLRMREKRFFGLTCESPGGNAELNRRKNLPSSGTNCRSRRCSGIAKAIISLAFLPWHGACSPVSRLLSKLACSELCHVACHWCRRGRTRRHPVADFAPARVVVAVDRLFWILLRGRQFRQVVGPIARFRIQHAPRFRPIISTRCSTRRASLRASSLARRIPAIRPRMPRARIRRQLPHPVRPRRPTVPSIS